MPLSSLKPIAVIAGLLLLALLPASWAQAHPHVWVTAKAEVLFDPHKGITGFRHAWTFDDGYSAFAVEGSDKNNDGNYDRDELKELAEVNVSSLKEFDYFTFSKLSGEPLKHLPPKDYWLEWHKDRLTLFFTLPLEHPVPLAQAHNFTFAIYDPTFYVDFGLAKENPVKLTGAPAGCGPSVKQPPGQQLMSQTLFNAAPPPADYAAQYAEIVSIKCPAS